MAENSPANRRIAQRPFEVYRRKVYLEGFFVIFGEEPCYRGGFEVK